MAKQVDENGQLVDVEEVEDEIEVDITEDNDNSGTDTLDSEVENDDDLDNQKIPYKRFKGKVDEVNRLKEELDALKKEKTDERNKELQEQGKYKDLYEALQEEFNSFKAEKTSDKIKGLLKEAGYKDEQVERLNKLVEGETEDEILQSIEDLKITFPTKTYVDPSPDNRKRQTPASVDGEDIGQSMFDRLKKSGKLKGFK